MFDKPTQEVYNRKAICVLILSHEKGQCHARQKHIDPKDSLIIFALAAPSWAFRLNQ